MKFYIETDRLILRELLPSDDEGMFELDSNSEVHKYLGNNPIKKIDEARNYIRSIRQQYADNAIGRWATIEKSTSDFIGWSGLKFIDVYINNQVNFYDVGYRFIPKYWGKGYATESCNAALEFGFNVMNMQEIIGIASKENKASRRVLEKCGLKFIEQFVLNGMACDWLKITNEEWLRSRL